VSGRQASLGSVGGAEPSRGAMPTSLGGASDRGGVCRYLCRSSSESRLVTGPRILRLEPAGSTCALH
jgi:hypothetical protein